MKEIKKDFMAKLFAEQTIEYGSKIRVVGQKIKPSEYDKSIPEADRKAPSKYSALLLGYKAFLDGEYTQLRVPTDEVYPFLWEDGENSFTFKKNGQDFEIYSEKELHALSDEATQKLFAGFSLFLSVFHSGMFIESEGFFCDSLYYKELQNAEIKWGVSSVCSDICTLKKGTEYSNFNPEMDYSKMKKAEKIDKKEIPTAERGTPDWSSYLSGLHILDYEWNEEVKDLIPSLDELKTFVPTENFWLIIKKIEFRYKKILSALNMGKSYQEARMGNIMNILLSGSPGSGKSRLLRAVCSCLGLPCAITSYNPDSNAEVAEGLTTVVDDKLTFVRSQLAKVVKYGGLWIGEEFNTAPAGMTFAVLSQVAESPYQILENGKTIIERHPMCCLTMCYNPNTHGINMINEALLNRFSQSYHIEEPNKKDYINLLMAYNPEAVYPYDKEKIAHWVYDVYIFVIKALKKVCAEDIIQTLSLRTCYAVMDNIEEGEDPKSAIRCFFNNSIAFDAEIFNSLKLSMKEFKDF